MEYEIIEIYTDYIDDKNDEEFYLENKGVHDLINEYGARLDEYEKDDARMILNQLYLDGYDDYWICIALTRILDKGSFSQWKYLLKYDDFIKENDFFYNYEKDTSLTNMLNILGDFVAYSLISIPYKEENDIMFMYNTLTCLNPTDDINRYKNPIEYYYYKYYLSAENIYYTLKYEKNKENKMFEKWYRGISDGEKRKYIEMGLLQS